MFQTRTARGIQPGRFLRLCVHVFFEEDLTMNIASGLSFGAAFGVALGVVVGIVFGDIGLWLSLGAALGAGIGITSAAVLSRADKTAGADRD